MLRATLGLSPAQLSPYSAAPLFGTGADGTVTISSGTTTLTRGMHYANLTISGTGKINTNGFFVFVAGTFDLSGAGSQAIYNNATNYGSANSGIAGGVAAGGPGSWLVPYPNTPGNGGAGSISGAATGGGNGGGNNVIGANGSGVGGAGAGASGGASGPTTRNSINQPLNSIIIPPQNFLFGGNPFVLNNSGGGGGGGQGDGTNAGGGGGAGGFGGGFVVLRARLIARGANATTSIIQAKGANGQTGSTGVAGNANGGGGGGGGGGGIIHIVTEALTGTQIPNALDVSAGNGGAGGNGSGSGLGAAGGQSGYGGDTHLLILSAPSYTQYIGTNGVAGSAGSASVGGAGGVAATVRGNL